MTDSQYTRQLVEDYLSITGRPAATLTAGEYLQFVEAGAHAHLSSHVPHDSSEALTSTAITEDNTLTPKADGLMPLQNVSANVSLADLKSSELQGKQKKESRQQDKTSKEEMLKLMRSVGS